MRRCGGNCWAGHANQAKTEAWRDGTDLAAVQAPEQHSWRLLIPCRYTDAHSSTKVEPFNHSAWSFTSAGACISDMALAQATWTNASEMCQETRQDKDDKMPKLRMQTNPKIHSSENVIHEDIVDHAHVELQALTHHVRLAVPHLPCERSMGCINFQMSSQRLSIPALGKSTGQATVTCSGCVPNTNSESLG